VLVEQAERSLQFGYLPKTAYENDTMHPKRYVLNWPAPLRVIKKGGQEGWGRSSLKEIEMI